MEKKNDEQFKREVYGMVGEEYTVLSTYINEKTHVNIRHNTCGHTYQTTPRNFLRGNRCRKCYDSFFGMTDEIFRSKVRDLAGDEYEFLDDFTKGSAKMRVKHVGCGKVYEVTPSGFFSGSRCVKCPYKFRKDVEELVGDEYSVIGEFKGATIKVTMRHNTCGKEYDILPSNFKRGYRCRCKGTKSIKPNAQFTAEVRQLVGSEFVFLDEYAGAHVELRVRHASCGTVFTVQPTHFLSGYRCTECRPNKRKTDEQFRQEVFELVGGDYSFLEPYAGRDIKLRVEHESCGHVYEVSPSHFLRGSRCPNCVYSRGEKAVADALDSLSIDYIREHSFESLGRKRFDFYIPSLHAAIEYDGEQHFEAIEYWGGQEALERTQKSDSLKNDFCASNSIHLLRIPYWDFDRVDEIVSDFINEVETN